MSTTIRHYCDRCNVEIPLVRYKMVLSRIVTSADLKPAFSRDLCSECLEDLDKWLLTPPASDDTVVATDNP